MHKTSILVAVLVPMVFLAAPAIAFGIWYYLRRRKRRNEEDKDCFGNPWWKMQQGRAKLLEQKASELEAKGFIDKEDSVVIMSRPSEGVLLTVLKMTPEELLKKVISRNKGHPVTYDATKGEIRIYGYSASGNQRISLVLR